MRDLLYITPPDGIPDGETEIRLIPLTGLFAIKTAKGGLERALQIQHGLGLWIFQIDGFLIAPGNTNWRAAAGFLGNANYILGRRLTMVEYDRLLKIRASDKERGIDLSGAVDINSVEIPTF